MEKRYERFFKEFIENFYNMEEKHGRWELWTDFLKLSAYAISNQADKKQYDKREEQYKQICQNYNEEERYRLKDMLWLVNFGLFENYRDFLGQVSDELKVTSKEVGQYYTPQAIGEITARILVAEERTDEIELQIGETGTASIIDCSCGTGSLLISWVAELNRRNINYPMNIQFIGQDINYSAALACYIQMSLLRCSGYVAIMNSLSASIGTGATLESVWYTPMYYDQVWSERRRWHYLDYLIEGHWV